MLPPAAPAARPALEQRHRLRRLEVLELHDHIRPAIDDRLHELVDHVVVLRPLEPPLPHADVVRVVQQRLGLGSELGLLTEGRHGQMSANLMCSAFT